MKDARHDDVTHDTGDGLFRQLGDAMHGPLGGWARFVFAITFVLSGAMFYCAWRLFEAVALREMVLWATACVVLVTSIGFLKDWLFSRMNLLWVLREIGRLETEIALLRGERR